MIEFPWQAMYTVEGSPHTYYLFYKYFSKPITNNNHPQSAVFPSRMRNEEPEVHVLQGLKYRCSNHNVLHKDFPLWNAEIYLTTYQDSISLSNAEFNGK
jgi:hypothetical protein